MAEVPLCHATAAEAHDIFRDRDADHQLLQDLRHSVYVGRRIQRCHSSLQEYIEPAFPVCAIIDQIPPHGTSRLYGNYCTGPGNFDLG